MEYPGGKAFAFTILDDTDDSTLENVRPIYELLHELGLRTTKTVWPLACAEGSRLYFAGETLDSEPYLDFTHQLAQRGFELAWHCATMESSRRGRTAQAFDFFRKEFGFLPAIHCNHGRNRENVYWGPNRYQSLVLHWAWRLYAHRKGMPAYSGESRGSPYFWGDLCRRHFRFVRNFTFSELNLLKVDRHSPYRLSRARYAPYFFSTSDAPNVRAFNRLVTRESIDRLVREAGVCILSTHLGKGFVKGGRIDPQVEESLRYLVSRPGWFVPASSILDHLLEVRSRRSEELGWWARTKLEWRFSLARLRARVT